MAITFDCLDRFWWNKHHYVLNHEFYQTSLLAEPPCKFEILAAIPINGRILWSIKPRQSQNRSVLKPLIPFCDWRGLIKESSRWTKVNEWEVEPEPSRRFNLLFAERSGIQGTVWGKTTTSALSLSISYPEDCSLSLWYRALFSISWTKSRARGLILHFL